MTICKMLADEELCRDVDRDTEYSAEVSLEVDR